MLRRAGRFGDQSVWQCSEGLLRRPGRCCSVRRANRFGGEMRRTFEVSPSGGHAESCFGSGTQAAVSCVRSCSLRRSAPWRCGDVEIRCFGAGFELHPVEEVTPGRLRLAGAVVESDGLRVDVDGEWSQGVGFGLQQAARWVFIQISQSSSFDSMNQDGPRFGAGCALLRQGVLSGVSASRGSTGRGISVPRARCVIVVRAIDFHFVG